MKVYIIAKAPFPVGMATTQRISCYAEAISTTGTAVEVIVIRRTEATTHPRNTEGKGVIGDICYRYTGNTPIRSDNPFASRALDVYDRYKAIKYLKHHLEEGDVVLLYLMDEITFPRLVIKTAHKKGVPVIRDFCEYPYPQLSERVYVKWMRHLYLKTFFKRYDGTICISESLMEVARQYNPLRRHLKVPIMVRGNLSTAKHVHERPYIFHGGSMSERKDAIIETMRGFAIASSRINDQLDFILAGPPSPHIEELNSIIQANHLEGHVFFLPILTTEELGEYQRGAFLSILNKTANVQNIHGFSNKLGEILLSGTPIITTNIGEAPRWLKDGESAYISKSHKPEDIADQIVRAFLDDENRVKIRENGKKIAERYFNTKYQGKRIVAYLKEFFA